MSQSLWGAGSLQKGSASPGRVGMWVHEGPASREGGVEPGVLMFGLWSLAPGHTQVCTRSLRGGRPAVFIRGVSSGLDFLLCSPARAEEGRSWRPPPTRAGCMSWRAGFLGQPTPTSGSNPAASGSSRTKPEQRCRRGQMRGQTSRSAGLRVGVQGPSCPLHKQSFLGTLLRGSGRGILGCL